MAADVLRARLEASLGLEYAIERELGGGGMSRVFLAEETRFHRRVVIKVVAPEFAAGLSAERFEREIALAAALQQANIVPVITAGDIDGLPWYSMPYVEGENLRARMVRAPLSLDDAVLAMRDVARALAYAHERGVVHRDIKPENVLLSGGTAVVTDFGIAKALSAAAPRASATLTAVGMSMGTPAYMSPEQALGEDIDTRADLYAWGVMAYELVAGGHPFSGRTTAQQLIAAHVVEIPPPLGTRASDVPEWLATLIHACLAKSPDERPASAEAMLRELNAGRSQPASTPGSSATPARELPSIAVLPFKSIGADHENAYFAEGVTDEILNALAHIANLRVAARTSTFALSAQQLDLRAIGARLGVRNVLEGSIRRAGTRIRLTVQLVSVAEGLTLWSERYDRELEDVFAIQDEIATAVVSALSVRLIGRSGTQIVRRQTEDLAAYELYLRGRHYWAQRGDGLWKSLLIFEEAIRQDPGYASAWSGIVDASFLLDFYGLAEPSLTRARTLEAAERAVELDPMSADAHASRGAAMAFVNFNRDEARREFLRALELNPAHASAQLWLAVSQGWHGEYADAVDSARRAVELDPLSAAAHGVLGWWLVHARRYDEALGVLDRTLEIGAANFLGRYFRATAYVAMGRTSEAVADYEAALVISRRGSWALAGLACALVDAGQMNEVHAIHAELEQRFTREYVSHCHLARVNLCVGNVERALELLASGRERREIHSRDETYERAWDKMRDDSRFMAITTEDAMPVQRRDRVDPA